MPRLDPDELRAYANRDWGAPERLSRPVRAAQSVQTRMRLAIELYESMKSTHPHWPDDATRRADFEHHVRLKALMQRAAHVGTR